MKGRTLAARQTVQARAPLTTGAFAVLRQREEEELSCWAYLESASESMCTDGDQERDEVPAQLRTPANT